MSYPKIAKLIDVLLTQTEKGTLKWAQTETSDVFQASFPRYSVRLYVHQKNPLEDDYVLQIRLIAALANIQKNPSKGR